MYAVAFAVDRLGDIYLDGRLPLAAVTPDELDRLLGSVLTYADESFNTILELGFASSIRKEWEWRKLRGESTAEPRGVPRLARVRRGQAGYAGGLTSCADRCAACAGPRPRRPGRARHRRTPSRAAPRRGTPRPSRS